MDVGNFWKLDIFTEKYLKKVILFYYFIATLYILRAYLTDNIRTLNEFKINVNLNCIFDILKNEYNYT